MLGWENYCKVLNYNSYISDELVAEYRFRMKDFQIEKFFVNVFLEYDNRYDF